MMGRTTQSQGHSGWPKLSPTDRCWRPALLTGTPRRDPLPPKPPEMTSEVGECPAWGSIPRSTRAWKIPTTSCDSHPTSTACSPLIPSMRTRISSNSTVRSCPSGGRRPRACSSTNIASCTSRSVSCKQRRIWHSASVQLRSVSCLDLKLEALAWAKKSCWTTSAQTRLVSRSACTSLRVRAKATNPSSPCGDGAFPAVQLPPLSREFSLQLHDHLIRRRWSPAPVSKQRPASQQEARTCKH
jgi:hypothetical protein